MKNDLTLFYNAPATSWMTQALPIGNGRLGGMIFGDAECERLQFNENTLWSGGEINVEDASQLGDYQAFGDISIALPGHREYSHYRRSLDLARAVAGVTYESGGIVFTREIFASRPDEVLVMRFSANAPRAHSGTIQLCGAHAERTAVEENQLVLRGQLENGQDYEARVLAKNEGGFCEVRDGEIVFQNCDALTLFLTAGTDYLADDHRNWKGEAPHERVKSQLVAAAQQSFATLLENHQRDHAALFARVSLDLGTSSAQQKSLPTDARLASYFAGAADPQLNALHFQFGRYLLISSSRRGSLPANLQGLWNDSNSPPWHSDYHSNINVQMNYWHAETTNLAECHASLLDHLCAQIPVWRRQTQVAPEFHLKNRATRGWTLRTESNPRGGSTFKWNKPANAWFCQHFWEHFAFSGAVEYLRVLAFPILRETVDFWHDQLKELPDGTLVAPLGWSPEHGPTEDGVSYDQQIIHDLLTNTLDAARALEYDAALIEEVEHLRARLAPPQIGRWGQLQEWREDRDDANNKHRHISHLFAVYPGRQISPATTPELAQAARISLDARGDSGTGWSYAWKSACWARLGDGDHAYLLLRNLLRPTTDAIFDGTNGGGTYPNLLAAHPPFQIDANFGATAAVAEMLLQSHEESVHLLPALPAAWPSGAFSGLRARGGFTISAQWQNGILSAATIHSAHEKTCVARYRNFTISLALKAGETVSLDAKLKLL